MSDTDLTELLDALDGQISNLEGLLKPLTSKDVAATAQKLPVLDQAKLHVLRAYVANSLIFSTLKINGVDPRQHPVFREIARTKQYFEKIKDAENNASGKNGPRSRVDVEAAGRFIRAGLAANARHDRDHANSSKSLQEEIQETNGNAAQNEDSQQTTHKDMTVTESPQVNGGKRKLEIFQSDNKEQQEATETHDSPAKQPSKKAKKRKAKLERRLVRERELASASKSAGDAPAGEASSGDGPDGSAEKATEATPKPSGKGEVSQNGTPAESPSTSPVKPSKKQKKKFKKSNKPPKAASEVVSELLKRGSEARSKSNG